MRTFILTKMHDLKNIEIQLTEVGYKVSYLRDEEELFDHEFEKCLLIIDIDTFKDKAFMLASKLASHPDRNGITVGLTSLEVDTTDSKFDFLFESADALNAKLSEIYRKYEAV